MRVSVQGFGVLFLCVGILGCAQTDYGIITDNDQLRGSYPADTIVNTNGKALYGKSFVATLYPDGNDQLFSMIDQKGDGTATITTYNNFSTGDGAIFKDDLYCNPDWNGCAIFTAPDDNDENLFDGRMNANCSGARSLSFLISTERYYSECGRMALGDKVDLKDKIALLNTFELGRIGSREALIKGLSSRNTSISLRKNGENIHLPIFGGYEVGLFVNGTFHIDATNSLNQRNYDALASIVDRNGLDRYDLTVTVEGISASWPVAPISSTTFRRQGLRRY